MEPGSYVRVVERSGWDVEFLPEGRTVNFPSMDEAMAVARDAGPQWIEIGEIVPAGPDRPQHHRWITLRRVAGGDYERSGLSWAGKPV